MPVETIDNGRIIDIVNPGSPIDIDAGSPGKLILGMGLGLGVMGLGVDPLGNADTPQPGSIPISLLNTR